MNNSDFVLSSISSFAQTQPDKLAIVSENRNVTYGELSRLIWAQDDTSLLEPVSVNSLSAVLTMLRSRLISRSEEVEKFKGFIDQEAYGRLSEIVETQPGVFARTSGSTGVPKHVFITFDSQEITSKSINMEILGGRALDELLLLPLHHSSGQGRLRAALMRGATIYLCKIPLSPKDIISQIKCAGDLAMAVTPATWRYLLAIFRGEIWNYLSRVQAIEFGSAPLGSAEIDELVSNLGDKTLNMHYGLTEASRSLLKDLTLNSDPLSIGKPLGHVSASIGNEGELLLRGPHTASLIIDGGKVEFFDLSNPWVHTGDLATKASADYVLTGRIKDQINVGGVKVSPLEVEAEFLAYGMPQGFAICGVEDGFLGETVAIVIEHRILEHYELMLPELKSSLPPAFVPTKIIPVEDLPLLPNMKLDRVLVKKLAQQ